MLDERGNHFVQKSTATQLWLMGARRIFPRGGQIKGLGRVLQRSPGIEPPVGSGAKPPEADDRL